MIDFHRFLVATNQDSTHIRGAAEALRQAALAMLKTPGYSHPPVPGPLHRPRLRPVAMKVLAPVACHF